jgi:DNA-binding CsgD family transcriptional regulator
MASSRLRHHPLESRVRELARALRTLSLGSGPALQVHLADFHEAIGTETGLAYAVSDTGDGLELRFMYSTRRVELGAVRSWLAAIPRGTRWAAYDPLQPERRQRNRVRVRDYARRLRRPALALALDPVLGIEGHAQVRSLLCEGSRLLAWVGGTQPGTIASWQRDGLAMLIPPLLERLVVERRLERFPSTLGALEVVLEQVPTPAFVVTERGAVCHANDLGRVSLQSDRVGTLEAIRASIAAPRLSSYVVTSVTTRAEGGYFLAIARPCASTRTSAGVAAAARRFEITGRQRQVLERLVGGDGNDEIAAALRIARSTVEKHVSALFDQIGVESRAALIARVVSLV